MARAHAVCFALHAVLMVACAQGEEIPADPAGPADAAASDGVSPADAGRDADASSADAVPDDVEAGEHETSTDTGACTPLLVINEVQTAGPGGADDEFVELYNAADCPVDLGGVSLAYRSSTGTTDHLVWSGQSGQSLQSGSFLLIGGPSYSGISAADSGFEANVSLGAGGGGLALQRGGGVLDMMGWGSASNSFVDGAAAPAPASGSSIARIPDGKDTDDNAQDFREATSTPRTTNKL